MARSRSQSSSRERRRVGSARRMFADAIRRMIVGWECYAIAHRQAYDSPIGDDYVIGEEWAEIGRGLIGLLNGDIGELDAGNLDETIRDIAQLNGLSRDLTL